MGSAAGQGGFNPQMVQQMMGMIQQGNYGNGQMRSALQDQGVSPSAMGQMRGAMQGMGLGRQGMPQPMPMPQPQYGGMQGGQPMMGRPQTMPQMATPMATPAMGAVAQGAGTQMNKPWDQSRMGAASPMPFGIGGMQ